METGGVDLVYAAFGSYEGKIPFAWEDAGRLITGQESGGRGLAYIIQRSLFNMMTSIAGIGWF